MLLQAGGTDYIDVIPQGTHADSLRYIRTSGMVTPATSQSNGSRLLLTGLGGGDEDILTVAVAKTIQVDSANTREILTEAGALGLVSYDVITKNVVLVPVNGAQCPQNSAPVIQELDKLYKGAVTRWQVEIADNLLVDDLSADFGDTGTDFAKRYTDDMNKVIKAFKRVHKKKRKTLYLFFVKDAQLQKQGYMPLAGDYGFIFNFGANLNTVAHELGHGAFNLRHTFSDKAQHYLSERSTKNLMDYANGGELWKYQWDLIHNPETILLAFMQNEDEGAYVGDVDELVQHFLSHFRCSYLSKKSINLPGHDSRMPGTQGWKASGILLGDNVEYSEVLIYFNDGIFQKSGDFWISDIVPSSDVEITKEEAFSSGEDGNPTEYFTYKHKGITIQTSDAKLFDYLFQLSISDEIKNLSNNLGEAESVVDKLKVIRSFSICTYAQISKELRIKLLEEIADVWTNISEEDELILIDLIETTPTNDIDYILTELQSREILQTIYDGTHNNGGLDNFTRLIYQLSVLAKNNPKHDIKSDKIYVWDRSWFGREEVYETKFNTNQFITITPDGDYLKAHDVGSFTFIPVRYTRETKYLLPLDDSGSQVVLVPAIYFKALHSSRITDIATTSLEIGIDAASLCLGIGELKSAHGVMKAIILADIALTASNIGINIARDEIEQLEGGGLFLNGWDNFQMFMSLATFSTQNIEEEYQLISDFTVNYRKLQRKFRANPDDLAKAFGGGSVSVGKTQIKKLEQLADEAEDALKNSSNHAAKVNDTPDDDEFWERYLNYGDAGVLDEIAELLSKQKQRISALKSQYGALDFSDFKTIGGKTTGDITSGMYNEMFADLGSRTSWTIQQKIDKIVEVLGSGSTIPQKVTYQKGSELYKIVKKGNVPSPTTEYWFTKSELDKLMNKGNNFEDLAGLPLGSIAEEYDIYKITANKASTAYRSSIAPTEQRDYKTQGGAQQTLVLDRGAWSNPVKYNTQIFIPDF